jgi:hypothetical protein
VGRGSRISKRLRRAANFLVPVRDVRTKRAPSRGLALIHVQTPRRPTDKQELIPTVFNSSLFSVATTPKVDSIRLCCPLSFTTAAHENCVRCDGWRLRPEKYY